MKVLLRGAALLTLTASLLIAPLASAQSAQQSGGQALEIGPPVLNLTADPGQVVNTSISIRDVSATNLIVTNQVNDFSASGEDGSPKVILDEGESSPFSIKSWIQPLDQLTLKPKEVRSLPITIYVPEDAAPGGYYGIVRFTGTPPNLDGTGVALNASLGTLIFIRVSGNAKEQLSIDNFSTNDKGADRSLFEYKPVTLSVRLKNEGNIYEQPTGLITVKDMFGRPIATLPVNAEERIILPDSTRKFDQLLDDTVVGGGLLFGHYTAEVTIKYGSSGQSVTATTGFWVVPYTLILLGVGILVIIFFVFRFLIRRYNRMIVRQATGSGQSVPAAKRPKKLRRFKK